MTTDKLKLYITQCDKKRLQFTEPSVSVILEDIVTDKTPDRIMIQVHPNKVLVTEVVSDRSRNYVLDLDIVEFDDLLQEASRISKWIRDRDISNFDSIINYMEFKPDAQAFMISNHVYRLTRLIEPFEEYNIVIDLETAVRPKVYICRYDRRVYLCSDRYYRNRDWYKFKKELAQLEPREYFSFIKEELDLLVHKESLVDKLSTVLNLFKQPIR